ncbi:MAG: hypothetical protein WBI07_16975 [Mobilitalea sp.]
MNIKASFHYQFEDHKKSILIFYFVLTCVYLLMLVSMTAVVSSTDPEMTTGNISGMNISTMIYVFIAGLCAFREAFGMLLQNGVSRKTLFAGRTLTVLTIGLILPILDRILITVISLLNKLFGSNLGITSLFEQVYNQKVLGMSQFSLIINSYFLDLFLYIAMMALGYMITLVFYRLNKTGRIVVGAGFPITFFILLPTLDSMFMNGRISLSLIKCIDTAYGFSAQQPSNAMITSACMFLVFSCFSWLLIRRANIKG